MARKRDKVTGVKDPPSHEVFVRIWQEALSLDEVVERTGYTKRKASLLASYMRNRGIELKMFLEQGQRLDVEKLKKIAKAAAKGA